jgi:hypothetical protein
LVSMRARNPWVLIRRLLRGRFVGFPIFQACSKRFSEKWVVGSGIEM